MAFSLSSHSCSVIDCCKLLTVDLALSQKHFYDNFMDLLTKIKHFDFFQETYIDGIKIMPTQASVCLI